MRDLFLCECRRYRRTALIVFLVHLTLLLFMGRSGQLLAVSSIQFLMQALYATAGLGFGLQQMASYRQPGLWLWLLHRPLPRSAIFGALSLAAATLIALAIGLPLLLFVLGTDQFSAQTVDLRHYLLVPFLPVVVSIGWLTGAAIVLGANRMAFLILALPYLVLMEESTAAALLAACTWCALLMAAVVYTSFKPDRATPPAGGLATALAALPLVLGLYLLAPASAQLLAELGASVVGGNPYVLATPGTDADLRQTSSRTLLQDGLRSATDGRAERWRRELPRATPQKLEQVPVMFALPQQLSNHNTPHAKLAQAQLLNFSHDTMRFALTDLHTGAAAGSLGPNGADPGSRFPAVPVLQNKVLLPHQVLYYDSKNATFLTLATLPDDEWIVARPVDIGYTAMLLTNRRLIAYGTSLPEAPYREAYSTALPFPLGDLSRIDLGWVSDGILISFTGGRARAAGVPAQQIVVFIDAAGKTTPVATRAIAPNYPPLLQQAGWWLSPVLDAVTALPARILPNTNQYAASLRTTALPQRSSAIWAAALMSSLLAATGAWLWRRRAQRLARPAIGAGWLPACLLFGLPCLAALLVMYPQRASRSARASVAERPVTAV